MTKPLSAVEVLMNMKLNVIIDLDLDICIMTIDLLKILLQHKPLMLIKYVNQ